MNDGRNNDSKYIANILVVDDTPENLVLLTSLLSANDYKVRPSPNGEIALLSIKAKLPDLILLDIRMPVMDGFEVCEKLKSNEFSKNIPVIFISAADDMHDKLKAFSVGGIDYITKPFEPEEVLARVHTHVTLAKLQKDLQVQNTQLSLLMKKQKKQEKVLIEQSKMAAMGEMISAIAHQWRQPLNTLALYVQDILLAYDAEEINEAYIDKLVSRSMKQINFMSSTINDFRNFFTPDKKKEKFSIVEQIKKTIKLLDAQFKAHNINIAIRGDDLITWGFPSEFQQVTLNLINNSKDAIIDLQKKRADIRGNITITCVKSDENFKILFSDNGRGIDEAIVNKIFEPYFTTKFPDKGTGIGLYMVKEIIERHYSGSVECKNNENKGADFILTLPLSP